MLTHMPRTIAARINSISVAAHRWSNLVSSQTSHGCRSLFTGRDPLPNWYGPTRPRSRLPGDEVDPPSPDSGRPCANGFPPTPCHWIYPVVGRKGCYQQGIGKRWATREDRLQPRVFRDNFRIANRTGWPTLRSLTTPDRGGPPNWRRQFVEQ